MRKKILIYKDDGCSNLDNLYINVNKHYADKGIEVGFTDASEIIKENALNSEVLAFFMPGGASTPYRKKLEHYGDDKIRSFINDGGVYFGICAGAYYACNKTEFEMDIANMAIETTNPLNLIDAKAIGTLHKEYNIKPYSKSAASATVSRVKWNDDNEEHFTLYHGGPRFDVKDKNIQVLATYNDISGDYPAIIRKPYGKGSIVAVGVHFEDSGAQLQKAAVIAQESQQEAQMNAQKLFDNEPSRAALFNKLMNCIGK
ncbi:MAG: hypothetical protein LBL47_04035 [Lactobacillus sp.]|jgi:glutamine amidotransferase-like uncharacterized protein|nr:hypothetical protein [Lactobacillus sp.]